MYSWHHRPHCDVIGFPYKRHHNGPIGELTYFTWDLVHFGSEFDCRVLMHARIDVLMRPCFWSLLPSRVLDWVVIIVSIHYQSAPLNTPLHPVSITSTTLCAICTGLSSFQLVSMSTVPSVQVYIFWSVSPPGQYIILPPGAHYIYIYIFWKTRFFTWPGVLKKKVWKIYWKFFLLTNPSEF